MKQSDVVQAFRPATDVKVRTTFNMAQGFGLAICVALLPAALLGKSAPVVDTKVDAVFAKYSASTPGCAVGVATGGTPVLARGFGMAISSTASRSVPRRSSKPDRYPSSSPPRR